MLQHASGAWSANRGLRIASGRAVPPHPPVRRIRRSRTRQRGSDSDGFASPRRLGGRRRLRVPHASARPYRYAASPGCSARQESAAGAACTRSSSVSACARLRAHEHASCPRYQNRALAAQGIPSASRSRASSTTALALAAPSLSRPRLIQAPQRSTIVPSGWFYLVALPLMAVVCPASCVFGRADRVALRQVGRAPLPRTLRLKASRARVDVRGSFLLAAPR